MWRNVLILIVIASALVFNSAAQAAHDVTGPLDTVVGVPDDGDWPPNELPRFALDDQVLTKYLHFKGDFDPDVGPTGFRVTLSGEPAIVTGMSFTTANDNAPRDPIEYELSGSNVSIDGPYTLIAEGPIVDFAGGAAWPRRTKNTTPIQFENNVAYKHYQVLFPAIRDAGNANSMQIAEVELLAPDLKATNPSPADHAIGVSDPLFSWRAGDTAMWHNVYLGTNPDLGPADLVTTPNWQHAMYWHLPAYTAGATYYWRVDEVEADGTTIHTGDVWSFTAASLTAYNPDPMDGAKWVDTEVNLSWALGTGAMSHDVYFGTDEDAVANGTGGTSKGNQQGNVYDPGTLLEDTTYYWRIDERNGTLQTGDVWSFTTEGAGGGLKGEYFTNVDLSGMPALVRIDPEVNFNWGDQSPGEPIPADGWSARWTADLEIVSADKYTFHVNSQDGTRLWIDGELVIDMWVAWVTTEYASLPIYLEPGIYPLRLEFFDGGEPGTVDAVQELSWSTPTMEKQIIPAGPLQPPLRAGGPNPPDGAVDVTETPTLTWDPGEKAAQHDVYFGTDETAVANADTTTAGIYRGRQSNTSHVPTEVPLEWDQTYYWKINEVNGVDLWEGTVWSFTVADFLIIDNFEDYNDFCNRIFYTWGDGWGHNGDIACGVPPSGGNGTGSTVGYLSEPYAEQTITHDGSFQSMPFEYLNDGSTGKARYSETQREFQPPQDFTRKGVKALTLWFQGRPGSVGSFNHDAAADVYTMTADGEDITGTADSFHYAYKRLSSAGSIQVQVLGLTNTSGWAKAGVMIREDLDPNSAHAMTFVTPGNGVVFEYRPSKGADNVGAAFQDDTVTAPHWVRISRSGNMFTSEHSADGTTWTLLGTFIIPMASNAYVGLELSSGNTARTCQATFSDLIITGTVTGQWQSQDIGITSNDAEPLYVALEDSTGTVQDVPHPDPNAVQLDTWQQWNIDLSDFAPVDLTKVKKMYIGVGDRNAPTLGGSGMLYIDDISLYRPRCIPSLLKPDDDLTGDCVVDYLDLEIVLDEWLGTGYQTTPVSPGTAGLVAHYEFDDTTNDSAGTNHGTAVGGPTYAAGKTGKAIKLDGIDDHVDCGADPSLNITGAITVSAWVRLSVGGVDQKIAGNQDGTTGGYKFAVFNNDVPEFEIRTSANSAVLNRSVAGGTAFAPGVWYHVTGVYSEGNYIRTYVNGMLDREMVTTEILGSSTDTLKIGCEPYNTAAGLFNGLIDELRIYSRVLSEAEIAWLADVTEPFSEPFDLHQDGTVDFKDYASLADSWLEERLWPEQ